MSRSDVKWAVGGVGAFLAFVLLMGCTVWQIPAGHVGLISRFGEVSDETLSPGGPYFVKPWASVIRVSVQTQKDEELETVPTSNGLPVQVKATMIYNLRPEKAASLVREVGNDKYQERVVTPYFKNVVRDITAKYLPESLYTSERSKVEAEILVLVRQELGARFNIEAVMLLDPVLPAVVQQRIEAKVGAEQDAIRMESVFKQKELEGKANKRVKELDAEAKVIEAKGLADAQAIIQKDLSHEYLVYLWIDALREGAKHNNAVIYVPTGSDGMPLFKGITGGPTPKK